MANSRFCLCLLWLVLVGSTKSGHERIAFRSKHTGNNGKGTDDDKVDYFSVKFDEVRSGELVDNRWRKEDRDSDTTPGYEIKHEFQLYLDDVRSVNIYSVSKRVDISPGGYDNGGYFAMIAVAILTAIKIIALIIYLCVTRCEAMCVSEDNDTI